MRHAVQMWGVSQVARGPGEEEEVTYLPGWDEREGRVAHDQPTPSLTFNRITDTDTNENITFPHTTYVASFQS